MAGPGETDVEHYVNETNLISYVRCEIRSSIQGVLQREIDNGLAEADRSEWLRTWGVKVSLKLVVEEKASISPGFTFNNPMRNVILTFPTGGNVTAGQAQNTAIGASLGSAATRTETIGFYFAFADLLAERALTEPCGEPGGSFLEGDLQLDQFLEAKLQTARVPGLLSRRPDRSPYDTFSYQTTFIITTSGNLTPSWKLVYFSANSAVPFLNGSRVETNDLTMTMGPVEAGGPSQSVRDAHLAALIGDEVARAIGARQP